MVPLIVMVTSSEELAPNSSVMVTVKVRSTDSPELMKSRSSEVASNDQLTEPGAVTSVPEMEKALSRAEASPAGMVPSLQDAAVFKELVTSMLLDVSTSEKEMEPEEVRFCAEASVASEKEKSLMAVEKTGTSLVPSTVTVMVCSA